MKLFTRYSRIHIAATVAIFLVASVAYYFVLHYILLHQVDEDLGIERSEIRSYVKLHHLLPDPVQVHDQVVQYGGATDTAMKQENKTIYMREAGHHHTEKYRQLHFVLKAGNSWFEVRVSKSVEGLDSLLAVVLVVTLATILLILIASFFINRVVLKRIWEPFYHSLAAVQRYRVADHQPLALPPSEIDEFVLMNSSLQSLTGQAGADYLTLKTFSENAAHEIQTPIAIVRSKLDLLIQDEGLTQPQSTLLQSAYHALQKLTQLNHHLLLLAKIENRQFASTTNVNLQLLLQQKGDDFSGLWAAKAITVQLGNTAAAWVRMNADLANILLNNLLSNATKHNYRSGEIGIRLTTSELMISNTSRQPELDEAQVFRRFYKPTQSGASSGLGLSIIKQIADASGLEVSYAFSGGRHIFTVTW